MQIRRYQLGEDPAIWAVVLREYSQCGRAGIHAGPRPPVGAHSDRDMEAGSQRVKQENRFVAVLDTKVVGFAELDHDGQRTHGQLLLPSRLPASWTRLSPC